MIRNFFGNILGDGPVTIDSLQTLDDHIHSVTQCFPDQSDPVTISTGVAVWAQEAGFTEIIASADAPAVKKFDIHWGVIHDISATGNYQLCLFSGPSGSEFEIACLPFTRSVNQSEVGSVNMITPQQEPGTRISAKLASDNGVANTVGLKINFHTYN